MADMLYCVLSLAYKSSIVCNTCTCRCFLEYFVVSNNDIHYDQAITQRKMLRNKAFHWRKSLMLSRPEPPPFTERVWLRLTMRVYVYLYVCVKIPSASGRYFL